MALRGEGGRAKDDDFQQKWLKMQVMIHKPSTNISYQIKFFNHTKKHPKDGGGAIHSMCLINMTTKIHYQEKLVYCIEIVDV